MLIMRFNLSFQKKNANLECLFVRDPTLARNFLLAKRLQKEYCHDFRPHYNPHYFLMSRYLSLLLAPLFALCFSSCASSDAKISAKSLGGSSFTASSTGKVYKVKTTAYCHQEADSLRYGRGSATGNVLKYGMVRSAAADWSVFPMGTVFRIVGEKFIYQVDDYGRALVGTKTIDLYRPDKQEMGAWGCRNVNIEILRWGSYSQSLGILQDRTRHPHVKMMVSNILKKTKAS